MISCPRLLLAKGRRHQCVCRCIDHDAQPCKRRLLLVVGMGRVGGGLLAAGLSGSGWLLAQAAALGGQGGTQG